MSGLTENAKTVIKHVDEAIAAHAQGGTYRAGEAKWAVASHRSHGRLTGDIIAICHDIPTLDAVEKELRKKGHTVERVEARTALIITPPAA